MALPQVSIRIPAYNHERYITACLDSVLNDSYPNKELIIIDDGSTDGTAEVIRQWLEHNKPSFPVMFKARENRGLTKTINELVRACSGKYLVSLASDDFLLDGGIHTRVEYLEQHHNKWAVFADCIVVDEDNKLIYKSGLTELYSASLSKFLQEDDLLHEIINNWSVPGPVLMVRKDLYEHIGYYNEKFAIEDWDIYIRMASKKLLGFINYPVSAYRLHQHNTCRRKENFNWNHKQRLKIALCHLPGIPFKYKASMLRQIFISFYLSYIKRSLIE
ncbi:glycosyltransferase [Legionella israelensis]|uniref:Glycosyl transferase, family 2 n=1 Tax=Legionella israelensis TaxID=454 RepID=A0A0W0WNS5_9GAMM|nr:glycosyltransferase [Legionella israelensis]KTD33978.1 glycosyl transferase, family 2 [Legionella israelensis]QBS10686.1 glycosyltransferase [Legionella israelensis]SCX83719.1 Glycosyl transferase family 2 [Legionella israelensis DSM 19235]STX57642.1 glycosyl transferase, family 2 [Legionella israelensis]